MIKQFKWWWAWDYEKIEKWLEQMEAGGLRLVDVTIDGICFHFEKSKPAKARYCIDYQTKLTPEYISLINDDGWQLFKIGFGWYLLRKLYDEERPDFYNDFEGLIARDRYMLILILALGIPSIVFMGFAIIQDVGKVLNLVLLIEFFVITAFYTFTATNLYLQIQKFKNNKKV
jgi:hypothetical protein